MLTCNLCSLDRFRRTPLILAAFLGHFELVKLLLANDASRSSEAKVRAPQPGDASAARGAFAASCCTPLR